MRRIAAWVWNADEADYGLLLMSWGAALAWYPWPIGFVAVLSWSAVIVGIAKFLLSVTRYGRRPPWSRFRPGLAVGSSGIWLAAALVVLVSDQGGGGWSAVLFAWLAYRSAKAYLRLLTRLEADAVAEAAHGAR